MCIRDRDNRQRMERIGKNMKKIRIKHKLWVEKYEKKQGQLRKTIRGNNKQIIGETSSDFKGNNETLNNC